MKAKRVAIYVRVSTTEQDTEGQEAELREYVDSAAALCDHSNLGQVFYDAIDFMQAICSFLRPVPTREPVRLRHVS